MLEITLTHYLILASAVFILGTVGVIINRNSVLNIFISVQLMVIGVCINLISFSYFKNNLEGQAFSFFYHYRNGYYVVYWFSNINCYF
jgi:NADH-quinone oxidoreductase subunit K